MTVSTNHRFPRLRAVEVQPVSQRGQQAVMLRDPLQLTDKYVIVPQHLSPVLALCDGTCHTGALGAALAIRFGLRIERDVLERLLQALDEALLLDNDRYARAREQVLEEYRQAPFRRPTLAGASYPADPRELRRLLDGHLDAVDDPAKGRASPRRSPGIGGLISPHIDYERGGPVYARAWKRAAAMVKAADLVVLLGTDHFGSDDLLTLTRQHYATPYGALPTAVAVVDSLAAALGAEAAFRGELRHRSEHSIELAAVWLHHIREGRPCELVPILCGSFGQFLRDEAGPARSRRLRVLLDLLRDAMDGRRAVVVAAGDLAHVGPAFGGAPVDGPGRARLQAEDDELIRRMCAGDAEGFFAAIKREEDRNNVCGLSPIYLMLRMLGPCRGEQVAYDHCPADQAGTSWVSVCGVVFE